MKLKDIKLEDAAKEATDATEEMKRAMNKEPVLFDKANEMMKTLDKANEMMKTPIITKDGELLILYHTKSITEEEKEELKKYTKNEIQMFLKINRFREHNL